MAHDRHHQAVRRLRRDADMDAAVAVDGLGLVVVVRVDLREVGDRLDQRLHQERQQGQLRAVAACPGVERRAQLLERGDVDLLDIGEVRDAALRLRHLLGDAPAQADDLDRLDRWCWRPGRRLRAAPAPPRRKASRSSWVMRPAGPLPRTWRRSTPASRARRRTAGEASGLRDRRPRRAAATGSTAGRGAARGAARRHGAGFSARSGLGCRRRRLGRCGRLLRRGRDLVGPAARDLEPDQLGADSQHAADLAAQRDDVPATGDGISTVALSVITSARTWSSGTDVADLDVPFDDLGLGDAFADVGQLDRCACPSQASITALQGARRRAPGRGSSPIRAHADRACPSR